MTTYFPVSRPRSRAAVGLLIVAAGTLLASSGWAQDKSGSKDGLVKLPSAGGTVSAEGSTFVVQGNTGAANFTVPLPELPARAGVKPNVTLTYNQMNGDAASGFGSGWRLDVPSIDVSSENGIPWPASFDATYQNDPNNPSDQRPFNIFRFRGERLILVSAPTAVPLEYRLEATEDPIRLYYYASGFSAAWGKPVDAGTPSISTGFEVVYPDGKTELYSGAIGTQDAPGDAEGGFVETYLPGAWTPTSVPLPTRFPLVYEVYRHGESVHYSYRKLGNKSYLSTISFAGGQSKYSINLKTDAASNVSTYKNGFLQTNGALVVSLDATYGGQLRNHWCFAYAGPSAGAPGVVTAPECQALAAQNVTTATTDLLVHDQLVSLLRYGSTLTPNAASPHDPALKFQYSSWNASDLAARQLVYPAPALQSLNIDVSALELLDANRDGLPDVIKVTSDSTLALYGNVDLTKTYSTQAPLPLQRGSTQVQLDLRGTTFQVADINGDSFVDIVEFQGGNINVYGGGNDNPLSSPYVLRASISLSDASGGTSFPMFDDSSFGNGAQFVDVNQDGLSDIVTKMTGDAGNQWLVYLNTTTVDPNGTWWVSFSPATFALPNVQNIPAFANDSAFLTDPTAYKILDVNGDGLPDFTWTNGPQGWMCVYENTGAFYQLPYPTTLLFGREDLADPDCGHGVKVNLQIPQSARALDNWILDVNGDGIKDFVSFGATVSQLSVWYGLGDLQFSSAVTLNLNTPLYPDQGRSRVADIDGDGQEEIILFQGAHGVSIVDFNRTPQTQLIKSGLLIAVETEAGVRDDIRYATSTDETARDVNANQTFYPLHFPVVVAKQVVHSTGKQADTTWVDVDVTEYFYHQPYYDAWDRSFRGFKKVDQLILGDEGLPANSQATAFVEETFAVDPAPTDTVVQQRIERHLWGRSMTKRVSAVSLDADLLQKIKDTNSFDPTSLVAHSLSTVTQTQPLTQTTSVLEETTNNWSIPVQAAVVPAYGSYFASLNSTIVVDHSTTTTALRTTTKTIKRDAFNIATEEDETTHWDGASPISAVALPSDYSKTTTHNYDAARAALAKFSALSLPSLETTTVNGTQTDNLQTDYSSTNGLVADKHHTVYIAPPPDSLWSLAQSAGVDAAVLARVRALAVSQRDDLSAFGYDTFGNVISKTDTLGLVEQATYDANGIFPVEYHTVNLADRTLDQITTMTYQPDGRVALYVTPLGLTGTFAYDELGRRSALSYSDGGQETYQYRNAVDGLPTLILTTALRYATAAAVPAGETQSVERLAAYRSDGVQLGELEDAEQGGVRVLEYHEYNRKKNRILTYTPFIATSVGGSSVSSVLDVFAVGQIPTPAQADNPDSVGMAFQYDPLDRLSQKRFANGKTDTFRSTTSLGGSSRRSPTAPPAPSFARRSRSPRPRASWRSWRLAAGSRSSPASVATLPAT